MTTDRISNCYMCGRPTQLYVAWVANPEDSRRMGAAGGRRMVVPFGLCDRCELLPELREVVKSLIISEAEEALAGPSAN